MVVRWSGGRAYPWDVPGPPDLGRTPGGFEDAVMKIDERTVRRAAKAHGPSSHILIILARQFRREFAVRRLRRVDFRLSGNDGARRAYLAIGADEFDGINARQAWANWRTIPRNLSARLGGHPVMALDLCCGTGESARVLAYYCPAGSRILGLDYSPQFVEAARGREYLNENGAVAAVSFGVQSVLETFRDQDGAVLPDASVDLVNAIGAVGCHFNRESVVVLARQCAGVVRPGGLAMIDSGRAGATARDVADAFGAFGFRVVHQARSCIFDPHPQLCMRKEA